MSDEAARGKAHHVELPRNGFIPADLGKFKFEALRESVSTGEPLNPEIIQTWQRFTGTEIRDFYGQTESTAMIGNPPWNKGKLVPGSFGQPHFPGLANDLFQHCANVLAKFKIPRIIEFVPEVPKTLSGKIRRIELRQNEITSEDKGARGQHEYFYHELQRLKY